MRREHSPGSRRRSGRSSAVCDRSRQHSLFAYGVLRPTSMRFPRTAVIIRVIGNQYPLAATHLPREGPRYRGGWEQLIRCQSDLTGVPHGPTSCALAPTLCNCDPTLRCCRPTHLAVPLTERLVEQTVGQWTRTAPARHTTRCTGRVTLRAPRLTVSGTRITPHAESFTGAATASHAMRAMRYARIVDNPRSNIGRVPRAAARARISAGRSRRPERDPRPQRAAPRPIAARPRVV